MREGEPQGERADEAADLPPTVVHDSWGSQTEAHGAAHQEKAADAEQPAADNLSSILRLIQADPGNIYPAQLTVFTDPADQQTIVDRLLATTRFNLLIAVLKDPAWAHIDRGAIAATLIQAGQPTLIRALLAADPLGTLHDDRVVVQLQEQFPGASTIITPLLSALRALNQLNLRSDLQPGSDRVEQLRQAETALAAFLGSCGLEANAILSQWATNKALPLNLGSQTGLEFANCMANIDALTAIELHQPGGATRLAADYGITMVGRYGAPVLLKQLEQSLDSTTPYGLMVYPGSDNNGAFFQNRRDIEQLQADLAAAGHLVRIVEAGSKPTLYRQVLRLNRRFNQSGTNAIQFGIGAAHGSTFQMNFDELKFNAATKLSVDDLIKLQFPEHQAPSFARDVHAFEQFNRCFDREAQFILYSCSTAGDSTYHSSNVAQRFSRLADRSVTAPTTDAAPTNLRVVRRPNGSIRLEQYFAAQRREYRSGELVESA